MDMPPAGQNFPKKQGFPWTCLRRVKRLKKNRGSHGHASGGSKVSKKHVPGLKTLCLKLTLFNPGGCILWDPDWYLAIKFTS